MMAPADEHTRLSGVYTLRPEEMLQHAIGCALAVSCGMLSAKKGQRALVTICRDAKLSDRAAAKILHHMLRDMVGQREPSGSDFTRLVQAVVALADEC